MHLSMQGFPFPQYFLEFAQGHGHCIGDAVQPSHLLSPSSAFNLSQHQVVSMSWLFTSGGQSIGASASVLPISIQDWFPLRLTGLIALLSNKLSRVFSSTTVWRHQSFSTQPSLWSTSHDYMTTGHCFPLILPPSCLLSFLLLFIGLTISLDILLAIYVHHFV